MLQAILDNYPDEDFLVAEGFDDAVIGFDVHDFRLIYSVKKCLEILVNDGLSHEDAIEHFDFNVSGSFIGERTPIWCVDNLN
jgi:hypothetical protein